MLISGGNPAFPLQALGERNPIPYTSWWYSDDAMPLVDRMITYGHVYKTQSTIAAIIDKKAKLAARLSPLIVRDYSNPESPSVDRTSPYAKLMKNPCFFMDTNSFWKWVWTTKGIYGEFFLYKFRNSQGQVTSLVPMHPTRTWIKRIGKGPDGQGEVIDGVLYPPGEEIFMFTLGVASAGLLTATRQDVIAYRAYNPDTLMRGLSPLEALYRTIQNEDAIRTANSSTWKRGAMPTIILTQPGNPTVGAAGRQRDKVEEKHSGPSKAGGVMVLPGGVTAQAFDFDPQKMQLIESLKLTREEACIRLDFPPPALHILDHATFSNITEQLRSVYRDIMIPDFEEIESLLDFDLRGEFFPTDDTHHAEFDLNEVLRGDFEARVASAVALRTNGIANGIEAREIVGLPADDDPELDKFYANQAMQPLGSPTAAEASLGDDGSDADPKAPTPTPQQVKALRSIMGKVGRAIKSNDQKALHRQLSESGAELVQQVLDYQQAALKSKFVGKKSVITEASVNSAMELHVSDLTDAFTTSMTAAAKAGGTAAAKKLGGDYDVASMKNYIAATAAGFAQSMNQRNAQLLYQRFDSAPEGEDYGDTVDSFYDDSAKPRNDLFTTSLVTLFLAKAGHEAATFNGAKTKTWNYSPGPKASRGEHAAMDGETVPINDAFSNGLQIAGDPSAGADENAGCECTVSFD